MTEVDPTHIQSLLNECLLKDRYHIQRQLKRLARTQGPPEKHLHALSHLLEIAHQSIQTRKVRAQSLPQIEFPANLPIVERIEDIVSTIQNHQVVIIAGETGSGKTTQLPKMCLAAGRGIAGKIGCTQPRRVAATSISQRVAEELRVEWGQAVGCKIRFTDRSSPHSYIKFMTDGILLTEIQSDRWLTDYDTLILDEAHERSLNIDFLLGYLQNLLKLRPELKLIVTSATIDTQSFSEAFNNAPILEVSGRVFPVECRYHPFDPNSEETGDWTCIDAAVEAVLDILHESSSGDILIFLAGEGDIHETRALLEGQRLPQIDLIPLYARLSSAEQQRAFQPSSKRKVILSTNIAETSLTIPGIRYVIDSGLARVSRYQPRTRTRRLPIEPISQSSANQRMGRSGRLENGICIRLYSEEDFLERPPYTQPEIQRANLADVILRMKAFRLGDIETFPFINPPRPDAISGGYSLLRELGALDPDNHLTPTGKSLAHLPVDPIIGRMILQSQTENALTEVLIIAAGLSIQDPRERPLNQKDAADKAHRHLRHPKSDFLTLLNIWTAFHDQWETLKTQNQMRKFCRSHFLSYLRMREWIDLHRQLTSTLKQLGGFYWNPEPAQPDAIHRSILSGLLSMIGLKDSQNLYKTSGNRKFNVFPGSTLFTSAPPKKPTPAHPKSHPEKAPKQPQWVMAGEIVETTKVYARTLAPIHPQWILTLGQHLLQRKFSEPYWCETSQTVLVKTHLHLFGLHVSDQSLPLSKFDPALAKEIFIREGILGKGLKTTFPFLESNQKVIETAQNLLTRVRASKLLDLDLHLYRFYSRNLPDLASTADLKRHLQDQGEAALLLQPSDLIDWPDGHDPTLDYPDAVTYLEEPISVRYAYAPGEEHDGVTLQLPLPIVQTASTAPLQWIVPGLRADQVSNFLKSLPKSLRRQLAPLPPKIKDITENLRPDSHSTLYKALQNYIQTHYQIEIPDTLLSGDLIPNYLLPRFELIDKQGKSVAISRTVEALAQKRQHQEILISQKTWDLAASQWERYQLTQWTFGTPPEQVEITDPNGNKILAFPGLDFDGQWVSLKLFKEKTLAKQATQAAFPHLLHLSLPKETAWLQRDLKALAQNKLLLVGWTPFETFTNEAYQHLLRYAFHHPEPLLLQETLFNTLLAQAKQRLPALLNPFLQLVKQTLEQRQQILVGKFSSPQWTQALDQLMPAGFLNDIEYPFYQHYPRYLKALQIRAERAALNPVKDQQKALLLHPYLQAFETLKARVSRSHPRFPALQEFRWLLEEFKVSCFAQELKTVLPVSPKRLDQALESFSGIQS